MDRTTTTALVAVERELAAFRAKHGGRAHRGAPIPEAIWSAAAGIAARDGIGATARALGLHAGRLGARVARARAGSTGFVEIPVAGVGGVTTVVELAGADGERMRIETSGATAEIVTLVVAFWERGR